MELPSLKTPGEIFPWCMDHFVWRDDLSVWGKPEFWAAIDEITANMDAHNGVLVGDCDDICALLLHLLRAAGYPARYLVVRTEVCPVGVPFDHCCVESDGLIFDCRYLLGPRTRAEVEFAGYMLVEMSGLAPAEPWSTVASNE